MDVNFSNKMQTLGHPNVKGLESSMKGVRGMVVMVVVGGWGVMEGS